ncbi:MAG: hypothetical protein OEQ47_12700 [Acidimicrobiia bacterium]|nr:hypothetical protein [Acidimicrobiia bacterium]
MALEALEPAHSPFGVEPVSTSAPQLGQAATLIWPTMNENSQSGQVSFGEGASGAGGGGVVYVGGGYPGGC